MVRRIGNLAVTTSIAIACLVGTLPNANANPTPVEQAEAALIAIQQRASDLDQQYLILDEQLTTTKASLAQAQATLTATEIEAESLRDRVVQLALAAARQPLGDLFTAAQLLATDEPEAFLHRLSTTQQVTQNQTDLLASYESQRELAAAAAERAATDESAIARDNALLEEARRSLAAEMVAAQRILDQLTASQRAQLLARRATARTTPSPSPSPSPTPTPSATPSLTPQPSPTPTPTSTSPTTKPGEPSAAALQALSYATKQLGKDYVMGTTGPDAFDCSGLTLMAYKSAGVNLPRTASQQAGVGTPVALKDLIPGDLVFYYSPISHVGIYSGNGMIVNAESPILGVVEVSVTWMPFTTARRVA